MSPLKLLLAALAAETAAIVAALGCLYSSAFIASTGEVTGADLGGVLGLTAIGTLLMCAVFYAPGLLLLRKRRGDCKPASHFLYTSTLILNLPVLLALVVGLGLGMLSGIVEASLFVIAFIAAGFTFGLVFVRLCPKHPAS